MARKSSASLKPRSIAFTPIKNEEAVPAKQTRESIEAELNASERGRVIRKLQDTAQEAMEWENRLQEMEDEAGLPTFYRSKPIVERIAALGMSQEAIDRVQMWLDTFSKILSGRTDELPDHLKQELAPEADAELTGAELLADIVQNHRKA
jgi:hypothetical protein